MRGVLWPDEAAADLAHGIDQILTSGDWGFVAETRDGMPIGFAEVAIRKYANGCETAPVPFLEGIWVREEFRRQGVSARLIRHVEAFLIARGFTELGSDALIGNLDSHAAHAAWGFSETERVVCFRKSLR
jgi:aminoglycoside 6'-N-acetyltransferase I